MVLALAASAFLLSGGDPAPPYRLLIDDLGNARIQVREEAAARLWNAGRAAWPALQAASENHRDPETRARARDLLERSRLRRRLSFRILEEHPNAALTLRAGATGAKIRLIRTMGRTFEETHALLRELLDDPNPEIALAAAEALYENRSKDWVGRLLELYAWEECPRAGRMHDLLTATSALIPESDLRRHLLRTGPRGRNRLILLSLHANLRLEIGPDEIRHMLRAGDPSARRTALAWIRDRDLRGLVPATRLLLSSDDPAVVVDALSTLRRFRFPIEAGRFAALMSHDSDSVRREAARTAASDADGDTLTQLRRLLNDPSTSVREAALESLRARRGAEARDDLLRVFLTDAGAPRDKAARLLAEDRAWTLRLAREMTGAGDPDRRRRGGELLFLLGETAALRPLVLDPEEYVRSWTLRELLRRERAGSLEMIEIFTRDPAEHVRFEAVRALVRRGKREHLPALRTFLSSEEYVFRHDAAATILERGGEDAAPLAGRLAESGEPALRGLALRTLSRMKDPRACDAAFRGLSHPDGRLRRAAANYLGRILETRRAPQTLMPRLVNGVGTLEGDPLALAFRLVLEHADARAAGPVHALVTSGNAPCLDRAVRAIAEWTPERLASLLGGDVTLNELVFSRAREHGGTPAGMEAATRRLLAHPDRRIRRSAAAAAEDFGAADALLPLVDDPEPSVRHAAIGSCARAGVARAGEAIRNRLDDMDPAVRVIALASTARLRPDLLPELARVAAREDCGWARERMELTLKLGAR